MSTTLAPPRNISPLIRVMRLSNFLSFFSICVGACLTQRHFKIRRDDGHFCSAESTTATRICKRWRRMTRQSVKRRSMRPRASTMPILPQRLLTIKVSSPGRLSNFSVFCFFSPYFNACFLFLFIIEAMKALAESIGIKPKAWREESANATLFYKRTTNKRGYSII